MGIKDPVSTRTALWHAHHKRCFYCGEPLEWTVVEIDHIIPRSIPPADLVELLAALGLPQEFDLDDMTNLVPTHGSCNRRKGPLVYQEPNIRFFMEQAYARLPAVRERLEELGRRGEASHALSSLGCLYEHGHVSREEVLAVLGAIEPAEQHHPSEPLVVAFAWHSESIDAVALGIDPGVGYAHLCDTLEEHLGSALGAALATPHVQTESHRNGESASVRYAFWSVDVEALQDAVVAPWEVTEVAWWSEVYEEDPQDALSRGAARLLWRIIEDRQSPLGVRACPRCGNAAITAGWYLDESRDEEYFIGQCSECGWSDWTQ